MNSYETVLCSRPNLKELMLTTNFFVFLTTISYLPNRSLVTPEICHLCLGSFFHLKDLDGTVRGAGGQPGAVEIHLGIVDHILKKMMALKFRNFNFLVLVPN